MQTPHISFSSFMLSLTTPMHDKVLPRGSSLTRGDHSNVGVHTGRHDTGPLSMKPQHVIGNQPCMLALVWFNYVWCLWCDLQCLPWLHASRSQNALFGLFKLQAITHPEGAKPEAGVWGPSPGEKWKTRVPNKHFPGIWDQNPRSYKLADNLFNENYVVFKV